MGAQLPECVTLVDVAVRAGVSRTTAGKVLLETGGEHVRVGPEARRRVLAAARALGYRPNLAAQQLRGGRSRTLGVLMDTVNAPVMNDRLAALERAAAARGYRLLVGQSHGDAATAADYLDDFSRRGADGLICLFDVTDALRARLAPLFEGRADAVFHGRPLHAAGACVRVDTVAGVRRLVAHLQARGRRRIGMVLWNATDEMVRLRIAGYREALERSGAAADEALIWTARTASVQPSAAIIDRALDALVAGQGADALVASNDLWAARLIQRLKARGLDVPRDVAVTGWDNLELCTIVEPHLTSIDQRHDAYAAAALKLALEAPPADVPSGTRTETIEPRLMVRGST